MPTPEVQKSWYQALFEEDSLRVRELLQKHRELLKVGWNRDATLEVEGCPDNYWNSPKKSQWKGRTALHVGVRRGDVELVQHVLILCDIPDAPLLATGSTVLSNEMLLRQWKTAQKTPEDGAGARNDASQQIHSGIVCDICEMEPISGARFKARKIHDYDLCLKCFESSGADQNDYDKMYPPISLAGRKRKADRRPNLVPDSAQKNSPNAAIDGAGSTAAAAENSGGNSGVVEEGASSTAPSGINNEDVTPLGQPSQGKSAAYHFEIEGNSTPAFSHHGTASEGNPEASWRTHQALQNYKASTNSNLSDSRSGRLNRASVAGPWDYFLSKDELRELLLSKDEHYDLDALAMAMLQGNIDVIVLLVYALGECDDPPYDIDRSVEFRYPASTENDIIQRTKLAEVTQAVIQHFDAEEPSFMAACVEEFRNHPDYGFLSLEQYLFHFSFTSRFLDVFSQEHAVRFRAALWQNVVDETDGKDEKDKSKKTSAEEMDKEKKDNEKGMDANKNGEEEEERPGGQAKPDEHEKATENNNTKNELWRFLLKLHDGQGRTPLHVAVDEATEIPFQSTLKHGEITFALTAPDGSGKLPVHRAAGVENLKSKFTYGLWKIIVKHLFDVPAAYREVRRHPIDNALAERGVSRMHKGILSAANGFRYGVEYDPTPMQLALIHDATKVVNELVGGSNISSAECAYIIESPKLNPMSIRMGPTEFAIFVGARIEIVEALLEKEESDLRKYQPTFSSSGQWESEYKHWWPALHLVASSGNYKLLNYFIGKAFDPFIEDTKGNTALHRVMRDGMPAPDSSIPHPLEFQSHLLDYVSCRQLLLKDRRRKDKKILDATAIEDMKGCINLLLQAGCDVFKTNHHKQPPYPEGRLSSSPEFLSWWYKKQAKEFAAIQNSLRNAANAITVTATLVATASYVGPLQPPRGYTDSHQLEYQNSWVTAFVFFDTLSFYFAIIAIVLSLIPSLPVPQQGIVNELHRTVTGAVGVVFMSIVCIVLSFAASSIAVVVSSGITVALDLVSASVLLGGMLILLVFPFFLVKVLVILFPRNAQIRELYKKTITFTGMLLLFSSPVGACYKNLFHLCRPFRARLGAE
ncbi:unnamed protein product [Calypogeia fissa]